MKKTVRGKLKNLTASILVAVPGFTSCGPQSAELAVSEVKHDMDEPTRGSHASMWVKLDDEQYQSVLLKLAQLSSTTVLPAENALSKRMQFWLDELDKTIKASQPELLNNVPKPVAKILADPRVNAFVGNVPVCYSVGFDVADAAATTSEASGNMVLLNFKQNTVVPVPNELPLPCVDGGSDVKKLAEILTYYNAHSKECQYQIKDNRIVASQGCLGKNKFPFRHANKVALQQAANTISIFSGLISKMSEEEVVAVLAHELGHYYRAHGNAPGSLYNFFYTLDERNTGHKPVSEENLREVGAKALEASGNLAIIRKFARVEGQKLNSELFFAANSLVQGACKNGRCSAACTKANKVLQEPDYIKTIGHFPYVADLNASGQKAYQTFETETLACLETLAYTAEGDESLANGLTLRDIVKSILGPNTPEWFPKTSNNIISRDFVITYMRMQGAPVQASNVAKFLIAASQHLNKNDEKHTKILQEAQANRLGYYTTEQEADEFSLEWLAKMGISPKSAVNAMRALQTNDSNTFYGFDYGKNSCGKLYAKNWLDANGRYLVLPLGDYTDSHHSLCYRIFNMDREIEAHALVPTIRELSPDSIISWADFQAKAAQVSKRAEQPANGALVINSVLADPYLSDCPYAVYH